MIQNMGDITWFELDALDRDKTLIMLPVSPLEQHGPHLPLGLDLYGAEFLTRRMGEYFVLNYPDWEVLLTPGIPLGSNVFDFPGGIFTRQRTVRDILVDYGSSLCRHGFKNVIVVSVHGGTGHIVAIDEACEIVNRRHDARMMSPIGPLAVKFFTGAYADQLDKVLPRPLSKEERETLIQDWHAGWWETSLMMLARPELVRDNYADLPPVLVDDFRKVNDHLARTIGEGAGYLGAPALASKEFGEAMVKFFTQDAFTLIERIVVKGQEIGSDDRSPLYDIPFMRTDFVRNSMAVGAGVLLTILGGIPLVDAMLKGQLQIPGMESIVSSTSAETTDEVAQEDMPEPDQAEVPLPES